MEKWNLIIDVASCTNCHMCVLACQDEYVGNSFPGYAAEMPKHGARWIEILTRERGQFPMIDVAHLPTLCNHCDRAPCIEAGDGAIVKRDDGIVLIDPEKARGRRDLVAACPYGAIHWNEELQLPQHWIFDAHLLDAGWKQPRGAQACATGAMRALKVADEEMAAIAETQGLEVLQPELGTKPRVYYKNLHRYTKCFLGASLAAVTDGVTDCVEGARIVLWQGGEELAHTTSDNYGDFKFDRLEPASGAYRIDISAAGRAPKTIEFELETSLNLGTITL